MLRVAPLCLVLALSTVRAADARAQGEQRRPIVHDAECYLLEAQNGQKWAAEDRELGARLAALRQMYGRPPNIIHIMWDDTSFGDVGIPAISKIRGFETPSINRLAEEGILFTRMYTEVGCTPSRSAYNVDAFIGQVVDELRKLGIAENTLLVTMADNGPMAHHPPPGLGMTEIIFRGGKGDFLEGGVRVPAFAWWPGVIKPGQIVGDIVHETDLYTTFARLGGATQHVPTDRVVDGVDQTALLLNGDTHGRRDYIHIYQGPNLGATVKGNYKKHWISSDPTAASGIGSTYYFLLHDTREKNPMLTNMLHFKGVFNRMRARHELWKEKYPDWPATRRPAFTGLANARPETKALSVPPVELKKLPFDPLEYIQHDPPFDPNADPDWGQ